MLLVMREGARIADLVLSTDATIHAPELLDIEVASGLQSLRNRGHVVDARAGLALEHLAQIDIRRHSHRDFVERVWSLRDAVSSYDAAYVALAETLRARLVTADARLARGAAALVPVELFGAAGH